ncbi:Pirin-1 [Hirschfeldia incana]|nr:Pirin-1 [Hirschfeldia incana]
MTLRQVIKTISADLEIEGDGAVVRKSITKIDHGLLDPFVSLVGFSGFESVTYMLQGGIKYQDFNGHKITIHEGDVQWMTAGKGIIHSEMPEEEVSNGLQLWINLPSTNKMIDPKALELSSSEIQRAEEDGVEVKVIAGESMGVQSPFYTNTPIMFLDFTLKPRAQTHQAVPVSWTAFAYVIDGDEGLFSSSDSSTVQAHSVVVFGKGDGVSVLNTSSSRPLRFLLIAGEPIGEPVVQYGPFVMNTQAEIDMTIEDYRNAKNGFERAKSWRSD